MRCALITYVAALMFLHMPASSLLLNTPRQTISPTMPLYSTTTTSAKSAKAGLLTTNTDREDLAACNANKKLLSRATAHLKRTKRPWGVLHCSVRSNESEYYLAPPPVRSSFGATNAGEEGGAEDWFDDFSADRRPISPVYNAADAIVVTLPRHGRTVQYTGDDELFVRLAGVRWLATSGRSLNPSVERILVLDASDLPLLPFTNNHPNAFDTDVESLWSDCGGDKPLRILLRRGVSEEAAATAAGAVAGAEQAANAAQLALEAAVTADASLAARAAKAAEEITKSSMEKTMEFMQSVLDCKSMLEKKGVVVETLPSGRPVDIMKFLGDKSAYKLVVWRAGCWGEKGVESILSGAFQAISAHLSVPMSGGKFWQTICAEKALQSACGPKHMIDVRSEADVFLEYCDNDSDDAGCMAFIKGNAVRDVRLDCAVHLIDDKRDGAQVVKRMKTRTSTEIAKESGFVFKTEVPGPWFV
jgi:hypothetical protein